MGARTRAERTQPRSTSAEPERDPRKKKSVSFHTEKAEIEHGEIIAWGNKNHVKAFLNQNKGEEMHFRSMGSGYDPTKMKKRQKDYKLGGLRKGPPSAIN